MGRTCDRRLHHLNARSLAPDSCATRYQLGNALGAPKILANGSMKNDPYLIDRRKCRRLFLRIKKMTQKQRKKLAERASRTLEVYSRVNLG